MSCNPIAVVYSIFKNGMWDDPAVANTGIIAQKFVAQAKAAGSDSGRIAPYLTWRFSYIICAIVFTALRLYLGWPGKTSGGGDEYKEFISKNLPESVDPSRFEGLVDFIKYEELAMWGLVLIYFCLALFACFFARPSDYRVLVTNAIISRRVIWIAWLATFLPTFIFFLIFPLRSVADWDGVAADVCEFALKSVFAMPGSDLKTAFKMADRGDFLEDDVEGLLVDPKAWCATHLEDWHETFYGTSLQCAWAVEDYCQDTYCVKPAAQPDLAECLPSCLAFALQKAPTAQAKNVIATSLATRMRRCTDKSEPFVLKPPPPIKSTSTGMQATREETINMYSLVMYGQRKAIVEGSKAVQLASLQAEYVLGTLIAAVAAKYLVPAALSVLGGLAEALLNIKAIFPSSQRSAWILIITTCEVVPVYASLLAVFQQLVGDWIFAIVCVLIVAYLSLAILTGRRILHTSHGQEEREKMYSLIWFEYVLRALIMVGISVALVVWLTLEHSGLKEHLEENLISRDVIVSAIVDMLSKKMLTGLAGTDAMLFAFLHEEQWLLGLADEARRGHAADVKDLDMLKFCGQKTPILELLRRSSATSGNNAATTDDQENQSARQIGQEGQQGQVSSKVGKSVASKEKDNWPAYTGPDDDDWAASTQRPANKTSKRLDTGQESQGSRGEMTQKRSSPSPNKKTQNSTMF